MSGWPDIVGFVRSQGLRAIAVAIVLAFAYSLCRRGIVLTDEGYLLAQVADMLEGKILYRDMDAFVSPGIWFFLAGLFQLVEPGVLSSRILAFAGYLGMLFVSHRIVRLSAGPAWAWATVGSLMVFTVWAFPAWTLVFYSPFAILFALWALERLLVWKESRRPRDLVICGALLGLSILCKQNYGAFAVAGSVIALVGIRTESRERLGELTRGLLFDGALLSIGGAAILLPTVAYFAYHGALEPLFYSLVVHPFVFMGHQDIAYPSFSMLWAETPLFGVDGLTYGAYSYNQAPNPFFVIGRSIGWMGLGDVLARLHMLLFWLPVPGLVVGAWYALRPSEQRRPVDGSLIAVLAVAAFVFLGVFPRADFNHLINVYQPVLVATVILLQRVFEGSRRPRSIPLLSGAAIGGVLLIGFVVTAAGWYVHTLRFSSSLVESPRGGVLVTPIDAALINQQVEVIRKLTGENEYVLTVPALSMLNFLAERDMPGRYYNLYEHHIAHDQGAGVVEAAERHRVRLVVSDFNNFFSDRVGLRDYAPKLAQYMRTRFAPRFDVAGNRFRYLVRRVEPVVGIVETTAIASCDLDGGSEPEVRIEEHLLFSSLYHSRSSDQPWKPVETSCRVAVPERATLAVSIDYRKPYSATRDASLAAEIWVRDGEHEEKLLSETIRVEGHQGLFTSPGTEHVVDLSKFAGREVTLRFRTSFRGNIRIQRLSPFDDGGYTLIWEDPRIERPDPDLDPSRPGRASSALR